MITVEQAIQTAIAAAKRSATTTVPITEAVGYVLAEAIFSDVDMPPFDKSSMDGFAVRAADVRSAPATLDIAGFIPAGIYPEFEVGSGQAAQIMTGAPLPAGSDSVQMVERTERCGEKQVRILESVSAGKHVARQGEVMQAGAEIFSEGVLVTTAVLGVLAAVGWAEVEVYPRPRVGILVTGNELVAVDQTPGKGQIRNSNGYAIASQVVEAGGTPVPLGVVGDDVDALTQAIAAGLTNDILLITGGVSMGELDLVEGVFEELGVQVLYNKVNIKPGKPTVFGRKDQTLVFGLPGNPVSASTVFDVIVRPMLRQILGFPKANTPFLQASLSADFSSKTQRENYASARLSVEDGRLICAPVRSKGSADILAYAKSNAYLRVPSELSELRQEDTVQVLPRSDFWQTSG